MGFRQENAPQQETPLITYRATLDVPTETLHRFTSWIRQHRRRIGTRPGIRAANCRAQALMVLRWLRHNTPIADLARDAGLGISTACRYLHEGLDILAEQAPDLHQVVDQARAGEVSHLLLDGTLIPTDRCRIPNPDPEGKGYDWWYSGKHSRHGGNVQIVADATGFPLWAAPVEPGSTPDICAARLHVLPVLYPASARGLPTLTDKGYQGAGIGIHHPVKGDHLDPDTTCRNALLSRLRALGERANALLKTRWTALNRIRLCPWRITTIVRAALVLTTLERGRY